MPISILRAVAFFTVFALASPAAAWNYPEHEMLGRTAYNVMVDMRPEAAALLGEMADALPGDGMCAKGGIGDLTGDSGCFTIADLPALAADHALDPLGLVERWLVDGESSSMNSMRNVWMAWTEPSTCPPTHPDRAGFLDVVRKYRIPNGPDGLDAGISSVDGDYVCLASLGSEHFRLPGVAVRYQISAPEQNAVKSYAIYHGVALMLADMGHDAQGDTRRKYLAVALLAESFSLHFLQDSVAAGHILTPATYFQSASTKATHDKLNGESLEVQLDRRLCSVVYEARFEKLLPRLHGRCDATMAPDALGHLLPRPRVRGDMSISRGLVAADPYDVSEELVLISTLASLKWFINAGLGVTVAQSEETKAKLAHLPIIVGNIIADKSTNPRDTARVMAVKRAIDSQGGCRAAITDLADQTTDVESFINALGTTLRSDEDCTPIEFLSFAAHHGDLSALRGLPEPAEYVPPSEVFAGGAIRAFTIARPYFTATHESGLALGIGVGVANYFPPFGGMRLAVGADLLFYYYVADSSSGPTAAPRNVGGQLWASVGMDPDKFPIFGLIGFGVDNANFIDKANGVDEGRVALSLITGVGIDLAVFDRVNVRFAVPFSFVWFVPDGAGAKHQGVTFSPGLEAGIAIGF